VSGAFFDTNVALYLLSADESKADRAEDLIARGGVISVQVLNEFASVAQRKLGMPWREIADVLSGLRAVCDVRPLTEATHDAALDLARRHGFAFYDAVIAASALEAGCDTLYSEDFQHGFKLERRLSFCNPFLP
jgi:predicted nucleic acid-binding protein